MLIDALSSAHRVHSSLRCTCAPLLLTQQRHQLKKQQIEVSSLYESRRYRIYRPIVGTGEAQWRPKMGDFIKRFRFEEYAHVAPDPRPYPEPAVNNYFGKSRIWNPIAGKIGIINRKAEEWNWPHEPPPPTGLRQSPEYFPFFCEQYFPSTEVKLILDSVLNNETSSPVFQVPQEMSRQEIRNYLTNIYGIDNIIDIHTHNIHGPQFKNEVGKIKKIPNYKLATVELDSPVTIEFKQIKGTEDTPDNKPKPKLT